MAKRSGASMASGSNEPENKRLKFPGQREDYLKWDDYFMSVALVAAQRSKDPNTQVGACIVNEHRQIVGVGYNALPYGFNDPNFSWWNIKEKLKLIVHAETNAIDNAKKSSSDLKKCTVYVSLFPCNDCAQYIINMGIKNIIYMSDHKSHKRWARDAKRKLNEAGVSYNRYQSSYKGLQLDFTNFHNQQIEKNTN